MEGDHLTAGLCTAPPAPECRLAAAGKGSLPPESTLCMSIQTKKKVVSRFFKKIIEGPCDESQVFAAEVKFLQLKE